MAVDDPENSQTRPIAVQHKASQLRAQAAQADKQRRWVLWGGSAALVLLVIVAFVVSLVQGAGDAGKVPANISGGEFMVGSSAVLSSDAVAEESTVDIRMVFDFDCANCASFFVANGENIRGWSSSGKVTVELEPVAFSASSYSYTATNAAACVANYSPDSFLAFTLAMMEPSNDGTLTKDEAQISQIATETIGVTSSALNSCIQDGTYKNWAVQTADDFREGRSDAVAAGEDVLPEVFVNGEQFTGTTNDPIAFSSFVFVTETQAPSESVSVSSSPSASE